MQHASNSFTSPRLKLPSKGSISNTRAPNGDSATAELISDLPTSQGFAALLVAYRNSGGTARSDDVDRLLEDYRMGHFDSVSTLVATDELFGFEWRSIQWIPMFQFELRDLSIKPATGLVLAELGGGFNGWERAAWFAQRNSWLNDQRPVDLIDHETAEVLGAARADRFIAVG